MHRMLLIAVLLTANVVWAQQNAIPSAPHILVYGSASAQAIPDQFRIKLIISVTDMDANAARKRAEQILQEVLSGLRDAGVIEQDIVATNLEISPKNTYDRDTEQDIFIGTNVGRIISATFDDMDSLSGFLESAEINRELQLEGVETALRNEFEMMLALRAEAIADSRHKAERLAQEYGVTLQGIYSVSDVAPNFDYGIAFGRWPSRLIWDNDLQALQRVMVTGSRLDDSVRTSFSTGYITLTDKIYTVFLISDKDES